MELRDLIKNARAPEIAVKEPSTSSNVIDALTLFGMLSRMGKEIRFEGPSQLPPSFGWLNLPFLASKTAVLAIKEIAPFVSKISYEKSDQDLKLCISLNKGELKKELVEVEGVSSPDLTFIVGESATEHNPDITFNPHPRLWNPRKAFEAGLLLLSPFQVPGLRLLQRALLKLEYLKEKRLCIVQLSQKDFRETQSHPPDVKHIAKELADWGIQTVSLCVLFATHGGKGQGLLFTSQSNARSLLMQSFKGIEKGNWTLFEYREDPIKVRETLYGIFA